MSESRQSTSPSPRYPVRYNPITGREIPSYRPPSTHNACSDSVDDSIAVNFFTKNTATFHDDDGDDDDEKPYQQQQKLSSRPSSSPPPLPPADPTGQGPVFDTEERAVMEVSTLARFSETVEDTVPTTLREALKVKRDADDPQQLTMTKDDDDDFEGMVAAEMEALRLEYGIAKGKQSIDNEGEYSNVAATACRWPPGSAQSSSGLQYRSIIPTRDQNEERRRRRQKAQEYGAQLRMQMEQDAKTKNGNRISKDAMHMQEDISQPRPDNDNAPMSYGEQLRLQMKQEQQRRQFQKELDQSCEFNGTSGGFIFGCRDDASNTTSKQRKASEYKRQLDEQIDERRRRDSTHEACGTKQPLKGSEEVSGYAGLQTGSRSTRRYQQALDYKRHLDEQIEEKHRLSAPPTATPMSDNRDDGTLSTGIRNVSEAQKSDQSKARQRKKEYGRQLREQMCKAEMDRRSPEEKAPNATSLPCFVSSEDREVHDREKKREDAVRHQQMLRKQIEEQKKAREKERAKERAESMQYVPFGDLTRSKSHVENSSSPPSPTPNSDNSHKEAKATSPMTFEGTAVPLHSSEASVVLASETTFVAAPSSTTRRKPRELSSTSTPVAVKVDRKPCIQDHIIRQKARGGEAFVVHFDGDNCKEGEEKSVCKRQPREKGTKRTCSASDPSVAPVSAAGANANAPIRATDSDDILGQGMIQSALQKVEQNIPNGVEYRSSTCTEKKSTQPLNELASENVNPRNEAKSLDTCSREERYGYENDPPNDAAESRKYCLPPIRRASQQNLPGESRQAMHDVNPGEVSACHSFESDIDENANDDEAEERLMQALSRIRNIMDTSLSDH